MKSNKRVACFRVRSNRARLKLKRKSWKIVKQHFTLIAGGWLRCDDAAARHTHLCMFELLEKRDKTKSSKCQSGKRLADSFLHPTHNAHFSEHSSLLLHTAI